MGEDLQKRIAKAQAELDAKNRPKDVASGNGAGRGLRMGSDFVASVLVGALLGWGIDWVFGVSPWGLIVCLLLGFATGVRLIIKVASQSGPPSAGTDTKDKGDGA